MEILLQILFLGDNKILCQCSYLHTKASNMKKQISLLLISLGVTGLLFAQPKPKPKQSSQSEMDRQMAEAMKDMSPEEQAEMKKMMGQVMPELMQKNTTISDNPAFSDNKLLIPKKDIVYINSIPKKIFTKTDITTSTASLFSKLMLKAAPEEKTIINKIIAKEKKGTGMMGASVTAFIQGHSQAAMGLAMKAVLANPDNPVYQNNLAAILSQSGYPEKAIPYLRKLQQQFPGNSTVLE